MFVSAAAGAVGSAMVQIAKAKGMTVIGSAGGAEKCAFVRSLGVDQVDRLQAPGPILKALAAAAPDGIDVYFDNVGGDHLDAALALARNYARFAICGMIDCYNSGRATKPALHHADHRRAHPAARGSSCSTICRAWPNSTREMGAVDRGRHRQVARDDRRRPRRNAATRSSACSAAPTPGKCWSGFRTCRRSGSPLL